MAAWSAVKEPPRPVPCHLALTPAVNGEGRRTDDGKWREISRRSPEKEFSESVNYLTLLDQFPKRCCLRVGRSGRLSGESRATECRLRSRKAEDVMKTIDYQDD